jgi:hypothetical protein
VKCAFYLGGWILLSCAVTARAADPTITQVKNLPSLTTATPMLNVFFLPVAPMETSDVQNKGNWKVMAVYVSKDKPPKFTAQPLGLDHVDVAKFTSTGRADVYLSAPAEKDYDHVLVQYSGPVGASTKTAKLTAAPAAGFVNGLNALFSASKGKDGADINLNGTISPAVGSGPTYATDSSLAFKVAHIHSDDNWWALSASAKTDNRKVADPGSFRWRFAWQQAARTLYAPNWDIGVIGMEFDTKGQAVNLLASPRAVSPLLLRPWNSNGKWAGVVEFDVYGGIEAGGNLKDSFLFTGDKRLNGTHGLFRGVPGATLTFKHLEKLTVTSDYQVRLLAEPEIFLETRRHTKDPIPEIRQQPRHYWVTNITYKLSDALGFTVKHEYGCLPPAFTFIQHKVSLGFTLLLKENRTLRIY